MSTKKLQTSVLVIGLAVAGTVAGTMFSGDMARGSTPAELATDATDTRLVFVNRRAKSDAEQNRTLPSIAPAPLPDETEKSPHDGEPGWLDDTLRFFDRAEDRTWRRFSYITETGTGWFKNMMQSLDSSTARAERRARDISERIDNRSNGQI